MKATTFFVLSKNRGEVALPLPMTCWSLKAAMCFRAQ